MAKRRVDPSNTTLLALCVSLGGFRKGGRVCLFIAQWAILAAELGREPSMNDYIDAGWESERSSWRHLAEFRELFPHLQNPQPFAALVPGAVDVASAVAAAGSVKVPADLVPA